MKHARRSKPKSKSKILTLASLGLAAYGIAVAARKRNESAGEGSSETIDTDAPHWTLKRPSDRAMFGKSLLINRPRQELFDAWKVERFPEFMENVVSVERESGDVSTWTVKAPGGREVHLVNKITKSVPGESIYWQSEPGSDIANSGEVRFTDAPGDRGTFVSLIMAYDPPAGQIGRWAAKILQREPEVQARRDLYRFKQLMETGEVTTNASPSGRSSESVTEAHI